MNVFKIPPLPVDEEIAETLLRGKGVRVERIISWGQTSGWYDQDEDEWVLLLRGEAHLEYESGIKRLKDGDCVFIKAHERHRVSYTSKPCVWLCVFGSKLSLM